MRGDKQGGEDRTTPDCYAGGKVRREDCWGQKIFHRLTTSGMARPPRHIIPYYVNNGLFIH